MNILITGSTGFLGTPLAEFLESQGHKIYHLVRTQEDSSDKIYWDIDRKYIDTRKLNSINSIDAVINLAGENIAAGKWTKEIKQKIYDSRINGTMLLATTLEKLGIKPDVWINASAVGYYGNTQDKLNYEDSENGRDFLANVCRNWEEAAFSVSGNGTRVVVLRFGIILSKDGGMLGKILPIFKAGPGGILGNGQQYFSWVAREDVINIINFALNSDISGVFNTVSPDMVTNEEFTKSLGKALNRPVFLSVPEFLLKLLYGEMAEALLLSSTKVSSNKIMNAGYYFMHPNLDEFLINEFRNK